MKQLKYFIFILLFITLSGNVLSQDICAITPSSSLVVNVMNTGAKGDGITDDTAAIQTAINKAEGTGGTVLIPDGTYMINAITSISIKSKMTFSMSKETTLKAIPNKKEVFNIINIENAVDANIVGGTIIGERTEHLGTSGEWGMGIRLYGATNIIIKNVKVKNNWGDGFYIAGASKDIKFCSVTADNNRRQGMSIISVNGMIVDNSTFKNTNGTAPQAGIDIEPNKNDIVEHVKIINSSITNNHGAGVAIYVGETTFRKVRSVTIENNSISNNSAGGISLTNTNDNKIINNTVTNNKTFGISLNKGTNTNFIERNILRATNGLKDEGKNILDSNVIE